MRDLIKCLQKKLKGVMKWKNSFSGENYCNKYFLVNSTPTYLTRRYEIDPYLVVRLQFWSSRKFGVTPSLILLTGWLWLKVVVSVRVSTMGQIDLFEIMISNDLIIHKYNDSKNFVTKYKMFICLKWFKFIDILALKTLTLKLNIKCLHSWNHLELETIIVKLTSK